MLRLVLSFWFWVVRSRFQLDSCTLSVVCINKWGQGRAGQERIQYSLKLVELVDECNQIDTDAHSVNSQVSNVGLSKDLDLVLDLLTLRESISSRKLFHSSIGFLSAFADATTSPRFLILLDISSASLILLLDVTVL